MKRVLVPLMLIVSSAIMATAWQGHLRFRDQLTYLMAMVLAWLLVLPEYSLNILALRWGIKFYSGAQMAAFRLCSGVVCVALVSVYVLGEVLTMRKFAGFGVMFVSMVLIASAQKGEADA